MHTYMYIYTYLLKPDDCDLAHNHMMRQFKLHFFGFSRMFYRQVYDCLESTGVNSDTSSIRQS